MGDEVHAPRMRAVRGLLSTTTILVEEPKAVRCGTFSGEPAGHLCRLVPCASVLVRPTAGCLNELDHAVRVFLL